MKQKVVRKTLNGRFTAFTFDVKARAFFVKNFTDDAIFVSFVNDNTESGSFKIASGTAEELYISSGIAKTEHYTDTIYVKGTGEVEVEATDF